ncbi:hypothetical protein AMTRI_Chr11g96770 [Amborella trichopoda]
MRLLSLQQTHKLRLYHRGVAFCKKMRGIFSKRLFAAKYELRRKLYKAFGKDPDLPSDMRDKYLYKLSKLPRNILSHFLYHFRGLASRGLLMGIKKSSW